MINNTFDKEIEWLMGTALEEANKAFKEGEVPVGALIVDEKGSVISSAHNLKEKNTDPTQHAEILAIQEASKKLTSWRLTGATLFVTLEPCPMCLYAALQARVKKLVFGAYDAKAGAISLGYDFFNDSRFNHRFDVLGGVRHYECSQLMSQFFRLRRKGL